MPRCVLLLLILCLAAPAWAFVAGTNTVCDGDTLTVLDSKNTIIILRLYGIDAPEIKQAYGPRAKSKVSALATHNVLDVEPVDTDRYGRTVALVRLQDGTLLNEVLVAEGLAWVYAEYCHQDLCVRLRALEDQARRERRGLWAAANPERPADWRRRHQTEEWYQAPVRVLRGAAKSLVKVLR